MALAVDLVERVAPPLLTYGLGRVTPRLAAEIKGRRAKRFWAPVAKTPTEIILGRHVHDDWEPSGLIGLGDARALAELRQHFRALYIDEPPVVYDDQLRGRDLSRLSLILIGGPFSNKVVKDLWTSLNLSWRFDAERPDQFAIIDLLNDARYVPARSSNGDITRDYGLAVRMPSPSGREEKYKLFAFCGCFGYGTNAAARYATYRKFAQEPFVAGGQGVECLVTTTVSNGAPHQIEAVDVRVIQPGAVA